MLRVEQQTTHIGQSSSKVTVIVPVYNVEEYLEECLESISNQSFLNLEIIVVDDGSTDRSGAICRAYIKKEPRALLLRQKNAGLSSARNTGLDAARGDYIYFVDSDDKLQPHAIAELFSFIQIESETADVVAGQYQIIGVGAALPPQHVFSLPAGYSFSKGQMLTGEEALYLYLASKTLYGQPFIANQAYGKLWKRDLFDKIRFPNLRYEDLATTYLLLSRAENVIVTDAKGYLYRSRPGSIMNSGVPEYLPDMLIIWRQLISFIESNYLYLLPVASHRAYLELMHWSLSRLPWWHNFARLFYREAGQYLKSASAYEQKQARLLLEGKIGYFPARLKRAALKRLKKVSARGRQALWG